MKDAAPVRHGGALLVDCLVAQGVERVFCIPGESFLAALDGLRDSSIDVVVARHEGGAAMMAEATGKLTGRPGIAFVTRGPGATNASSGVHVAFQDSTPMVLFVGQVASDQRDREAFQEVDYRAMFGPLAKWVAEIDRADRIPGIREPRVPCRPDRTAGAGGARITRGHALGSGGGRASSGGDAAVGQGCR